MFIKNYFTRKELTLWGGSVLTILLSFLLFRGDSLLTLAASLIGVTSLIFNAKGNPLGQLMMIVFSLLYGIISFSFSYFGEMLTYLGMTAPMAVFSMLSWLRNPYEGNKSEVKVNHLEAHEKFSMVILTVVVTTFFYFVLRYFHTSNLLPSTVSVMTSFLAVYLTYKRSSYYAVAYAANDMVLVFLWLMASVVNRMYLSVAVCFGVFLLNDIYGFISWQKMKERQSLCERHSLFLYDLRCGIIGLANRAFAKVYRVQKCAQKQDKNTMCAQAC